MADLTPNIVIPAEAGIQGRGSCLRRNDEMEDN